MARKNRNARKRNRRQSEETILLENAITIEPDSGGTDEDNNWSTIASIDFSIFQAVVAACLMVLCIAFGIFGIVAQFKAQALRSKAAYIKTETIQLQSANELVRQISSLEYGLINYTFESDDKALFVCTSLDVTGPYDHDATHEWFTYINGNLNFYTTGSYDELGSQRLYNCFQYSPKGCYYIHTFQLIEVDGLVYRLTGTYVQALRARSVLEDTYGDFPINIKCFTGKNLIAKPNDIALSYDDESVITYPEPEKSPCGCQNCCCDVCNCNSD